jgi:hypothetical protein
MIDPDRAHITLGKMKVVVQNLLWPINSSDLPDLMFRGPERIMQVSNKRIKPTLHTRWGIHGARIMIMASPDPELTIYVAKQADLLTLSGRNSETGSRIAPGRGIIVRFVPRVLRRTRWGNIYGNLALILPVQELITSALITCKGLSSAWARGSIGSGISQRSEGIRSLFANDPLGNKIHAVVNITFPIIPFT